MLAIVLAFIGMMVGALLSFIDYKLTNNLLLGGILLVLIRMSFQKEKKSNV